MKEPNLRASVILTQPGHMQLDGRQFVRVSVGHSGLLTGCSTGVAFLVHYDTGWNFGLVFFTISLPFYGLTWKRMGRTFTFKTFAAVGLLALLTNLMPSVLQFEQLNPVFSALLGGLLMGTGMLILLRHRASLGGFNVLVLYCRSGLAGAPDASKWPWTVPLCWALLQ